MDPETKIEGGLYKPPEFPLSLADDGSTIELGPPIAPCTVDLRLIYKEVDGKLTPHLDYIRAWAKREQPDTPAPQASEPTDLCSRCNLSKPVSAFDGPWCKACRGKPETAPASVPCKTLNCDRRALPGEWHCREHYEAIAAAAQSRTITSYSSGPQTATVTLSGAELEQMAEKFDPTAKFREAAESCARDDIYVLVEHRSMYAGFHLNGVEMNIYDSVDQANPQNWYDQARALVQRVHRLRELLRQAGEVI